MSAEKLDPEMLATLTDEERAAFEDDAMSDDERAAMQAVADAAGDDDDDDDDDDDGDKGEGGGGAAAAAPVEGKGAADVPAVAPAAEDDDAPASPRYTAKLPADYADQVAALKTESADLAKQFKDGEIDLDDFQVKQAEIAERRDELVLQRAKAEISEEMNNQTDEQVWQGTIVKFMRDTAKKAGDIDYRKDTAKMRDLDMFVKVLGNDDANDDKSGEWFLKEAHKRVRALHGIADTAADPEIPPKPTKRVADKSAIPATLAQVPGGDGPGDLAGEFADMDGLEGEELERAIARMTPAQREKFSLVV